MEKKIKRFFEKLENGKVVILDFYYYKIRINKTKDGYDYSTEWRGQEEYRMGKRSKQQLENLLFVSGGLARFKIL